MVLLRFGRSGETCSKRSARNSEPCEFTHLGERHTRFREFSAVGAGHKPQGTPTSLVVYAHHQIASQYNCVAMPCFTKIKGTMSCAFLVHAHLRLLCNATSLRCFAPSLVARSTAFAHPKCRGAWVGFTCGRSGETCSKRSARNSEPCEFTHLGERHTRFREFSAVGAGHKPQGTPTSLVVYAHHQIASQYNCVAMPCFTKIKGTMSCAFLVHAHLRLLCNATSLRCFAPSLVARSTAFAHPKCRGAWVGFTCGRSGET